MLTAERNVTVNRRRLITSTLPIVAALGVGLTVGTMAGCSAALTAPPSAVHEDTAPMGYDVDAAHRLSELVLVADDGRVYLPVDTSDGWDYDGRRYFPVDPAAAQ